MSVQVGSEPQLSLPGEEAQWQERWGQAAKRSGLPWCQHLPYAVRVLPPGSPGSPMPIIAEASSSPFALPVRSFKFCSNTVSEPGDQPRLPAPFEEVPESRMTWTARGETGGCWYSCKELFAPRLPPAPANSRRSDSSCRT